MILCFSENRPRAYYLTGKSLPILDSVKFKEQKQKQIQDFKDNRLSRY